MYAWPPTTESVREYIQTLNSKRLKCAPKYDSENRLYTTDDKYAILIYVSTLALGKGVTSSYGWRGLRHLYVFEYESQPTALSNRDYTELESLFSDIL
jgi:hypothetical protein